VLIVFGLTILAVGLRSGESMAGLVAAGADHPAAVARSVRLLMEYAGFVRRCWC
jgi:hypothetical protein